jgi:ribosomal protein S18 acetylase RimI-like enzyme
MAETLVTIDRLAAHDLPGASGIIARNDLFPPEMLAPMAAPFLDGSNEDEFWLAAADRRALVGIVYCAAERMTEGTWNALLIAVDPAAQGRGVGRALMHRVEHDLAARGARLLIVETSELPAFEGTRAFYRRLGFEQEARIRDFYRADEDKIVFRRSLAP